jgi:DNA processing protein
VLVWGDAEYPARLQAIGSAPPVVYLRGTLEPDDDAAVAIVGSRRATAYGEEMARELGRELGRRGLTIVSGLARGIDAAAHRGAIEVGGRRIRTASLSSYAKAREIAVTLKQWILDGRFLLGQPVEPLPGPGAQASPKALELRPPRKRRGR